MKELPIIIILNKSWCVISLTCLFNSTVQSAVAIFVRDDLFDAYRTAHMVRSERVNTNSADISNTGNDTNYVRVVFEICNCKNKASFKALRNCPQQHTVYLSFYSLINFVQTQMFLMAVAAAQLAGLFAFAFHRLALLCSCSERILARGR
jgi:hypothetical protein